MPGHQRADIQLQHALAQQRGGHIAFDDALRQALDDGGLAHAGLADQGRVVLGAARQDLDDALDFHLPADDRVQFAFFGQGGQVNRQLVHQRGLGFLFFLARLQPGYARWPPCRWPRRTRAAVLLSCSTRRVWRRICSAVTPSLRSTSIPRPSVERTSPSSRCSVPI